MSQEPHMNFADGVRVKEEMVLEIGLTVLQPRDVCDTTDKVEWDVEFDTSKTKSTIKTENDFDIDDDSEPPENKLLTTECALLEFHSTGECLENETGSQQVRGIKTVIAETPVKWEVEWDDNFDTSKPTSCSIKTENNVDDGSERPDDELLTTEREPVKIPSVAESLKAETNRQEVEDKEPVIPEISLKWEVREKEVQPRVPPSTGGRGGDSLTRAAPPAHEGRHGAAVQEDTHCIQTRSGKTLQCKIITEKVTQTGDSKNRKGIHTGERPLECEICNAKFTKAGNLKKHKRTHTGEKPFECEICNTKFTRAGNVKKHKRTHTGEKPFECETCNAKFTQASDLKRHKRTHSGEKPFECEICNAKFSEAGSFKRHKRTHIGEKPFECEICNAKFTQAGGLKNHKRTHTGEKPFECQICNAKFTQSGGLTSHKRIHTGEKPFECQICDAKFTEAGGLRRHKRTHTGEK